jgi:hypothetical protein
VPAAEQIGEAAPGPGRDPLGELAQDGLDALRLDPRDAAGADRQLDLLDGARPRTAAQLPKRRRRARKATSRLRSFVDCDRTVRISSSRPRP